MGMGEGRKEGKEEGEKEEGNLGGVLNYWPTI